MRFVNEFIAGVYDDVIDYDKYAYTEYYYNNIQKQEDFFKVKEDGMADIENGRISVTTLDKFFALEEEKICDNSSELFEFVQDKRFQQLQEELWDEGINVCLWNIFYLAKYIIHKSKCYEYFKVKPQIKDTLSELEDIKEITFTNKNGKKVTSDNNLLIETILNALKEKEENIYEVYTETLKFDEISNNQYIQIFLIHNLTTFFNSYFKVKRRKNSLISAKEQELIIYLMYYLKITPAEVTASRYRQLLNSYNKINTHLILYHFNIKGVEYSMPTAFIKYNAWKKGKIDWSDDDLFEDINFHNGDKISFCKE